MAANLAASNSPPKILFGRMFGKLPSACEAVRLYWSSGAGRDSPSVGCRSKSWGVIRSVISNRMNVGVSVAISFDFSPVVSESRLRVLSM